MFLLHNNITYFIIIFLDSIVVQTQVAILEVVVFWLVSKCNGGFLFFQMYSWYRFRIYFCTIFNLYFQVLCVYFPLNCPHIFLWVLYFVYQIIFTIIQIILFLLTFITFCWSYCAIELAIFLYLITFIHSIISSIISFFMEKIDIEFKLYRFLKALFC